MKQKIAIPPLMTLNWRHEETAFVVNFYPLFIEFLQNQFKNPGRLLEYFLLNHSGLKFSFDFDNSAQGIGFEGCLRYLKGDVSKGEISFLYKIPSLMKETDEICNTCEGTGISKRNNFRCYECRETGKKLIDDEEASINFLQFGLSVYILSRFMDFCALDYSD
jgi:hypothetical protein